MQTKEIVQSDMLSTKLMPNLYKATGIAQGGERKKRTLTFAWVRLMISLHIELGELRRKFEEDKQKLAKLRESGIFKPL